MHSSKGATKQTQHHAIVIIGAGIAGATIANEFTHLNQAVCIVDAAPAPATACSSHAYAIAHPHIGKGSARLLRLTRIAFLLAEERWGANWNQHGIFQPTKPDQIFDPIETYKHLQTLGLEDDLARVMNAQEAKAECGVEQSGVWMARGASMDLSEAVNDLLKPQPLLTCLWSTRIGRIERGAGLTWSLLDEFNSPIITADKVILAAAIDSKVLVASMGVKLPLKPVRGQLSIFSIESNDLWAAKLPRVAISGEGYCLPAVPLPNGDYRWMVGSSFDEGEDDLQERASSDVFNREQAKGLLDFKEGDFASLKKEGSFVGIRCVAGDRLPIIGALVQRPGIFLATALGSRGILWSALAAKLISAQVLTSDFALLTRLGFTADLVAALAPARFFAGAAGALAPALGADLATDLVPDLAPALAPPSDPALGALASNSKPILPLASKAK
jgi:tRNA 5-methylaminomethyl-2-thiouridine biosynthesis bifunctional protein